MIETVEDALRFMVDNIHEPNCLETREGFDQCRKIAEQLAQENLEEKRNRLNVEAARAAHAYACTCPLGPERIRAFEYYENTRTAPRR